VFSGAKTWHKVQLSALEKAFYLCILHISFQVHVLYWLVPSGFHSQVHRILTAILSSHCP